MGRVLGAVAGCCGVALAVVFASASVTHFLEPARTGLVTIVPHRIPMPGLVVTITGFLELLLAAGLVVLTTRRAAAVGAAFLLVAMFPANVVAAHGVEEASAPDTPLLPRALVQVLLLAACVVAVLRTERPATRA